MPRIRTRRTSPRTRRPSSARCAAADGQTLHYQLIRPRGLGPGRAIRWSSTSTAARASSACAAPGPARAQRGCFRQYLAQQGYVVFTLDNRGSGSRGDAFERRAVGTPRQRRGRRPGARRRVPAQPAVRRRGAHRRVRLELRRLHGADVPDAGAASTSPPASPARRSPTGRSTTPTTPSATWARRPPTPTATRRQRADARAAAARAAAAAARHGRRQRAVHAHARR